MPDFSHRGDLFWMHCMCCGQPVAAILLPLPGTPQEVICYSCTGFHPHILVQTKDERVSHFQTLAALCVTTPKLSAHFALLAEQEAARVEFIPAPPPDIEELNLDDIDFEAL